MALLLPLPLLSRTCNNAVQCRLEPVAVQVGAEAAVARTICFGSADEVNHQ